MLLTSAVIAQQTLFDTKQRRLIMTWFVFYHSMNSQKIVPFNIFNHASFSDGVNKLLHKCTEKADFAEKLKKELMYYFWCKSEYEVLISPWCGVKNTEDIKVDVYSQVMLNYDIFVDYVWSFKHSAARRSKSTS